MEKIEFIEEFKKRTRKLSVSIILFYDSLKKTDVIRIVGKQLIRSATSTAANYRAACIARSDNEFYAKMSIVTEEADETLFWLEVMQEANLANPSIIGPLKREALEISKVVSSARKNTNR
jgi:four helix bundle protein